MLIVLLMQRINSSVIVDLVSPARYARSMLTNVLWKAIKFAPLMVELNWLICKIRFNFYLCFKGGRCIDQINGYYCVWRDEIGLIYEKRMENPCTIESLIEGEQFFEVTSPYGNTFLECIGFETFVVRKCAGLLYWHQAEKICSIDQPAPKTDVCTSSPCKNNGVCHDLGGRNFKCMCKSGYTGSLCEHIIDFCLSNPCMNGGRCVPHVNGYNCICKNNIIDKSCSSGWFKFESMLLLLSN